LLDNTPERVHTGIGFDILHLVNRMFAYLITDYHLDIGTQESYLAAQTGWPGLIPSTCAEPRPGEA
jgi:hypothetical protein